MKRKVPGCRDVYIAGPRSIYHTNLLLGAGTSDSSTLIAHKHSSSLEPEHSGSWLAMSSWGEWVMSLGLVRLLSAVQLQLLQVASCM